jgi:8-oxo-dGTP pyrophosphatase MutT (NUDIX family)
MPSGALELDGTLVEGMQREVKEAGGIALDPIALIFVISPFAISLPFPAIIHLDSSLPARHGGGCELLLYGGRFRPAAGLDDGALTTDF